MDHTTTGIIIAAVTALMLIAATNAVPLIQQRQVYAASFTSSLKDNLRANLENKNQHLNQQGNCIRTNGCANSDVGQGTLGNDNSVTGFVHQSTANTTTGNAATSGPAGLATGPQGNPGSTGPQGNPGSTGPQGNPGSTGTIPDNSVTTSKLADGAVTTSKIANDSITADKIAGVSKLVFTSCTSIFNVPIAPGLGDLAHCSVPGAEVGDMVLMGASRNDPGAGNFLVHLAYVDSPGQITFFVRSFGTGNIPATITWPIILFRP
jgi:hypothetical protein